MTHVVKIVTEKQAKSPTSILFQWRTMRNIMMNIMDDQLLDDNPGVTRTVNKAVKKRTQARIIRSVWFNRG